MKDYRFEAFLSDIRDAALCARDCLHEDKFDMCKFTLDVIEQRLAEAKAKLPKLEEAKRKHDEMFANLEPAITEK